MTLKFSMAGACAFVALSCGSGQPYTSSLEAAEPDTAASALLPSASAANAPVDDEQGSCVAAECPDIRLFGTLAGGCCRGAQACGGRVQIAERSWLCVPPGYDRSADALRGALAAHAGEPLVPEPSCPSEALDGSMLAGCCISGSTCGVSTQLWTAAAAQLGLNLQSVCILASEAAQITGRAVADAGSPRACASRAP
ncbi:MAG: hypothetical protein ABI895_13605 [Deltaproteobacteria bacterium]